MCGAAATTQRMLHDRMQRLVDDEVRSVRELLGPIVAEIELSSIIAGVQQEGRDSSARLAEVLSLAMIRTPGVGMPIASFALLPDPPGVTSRFRSSCLRSFCRACRGRLKPGYSGAPALELRGRTAGDQGRDPDQGRQRKVCRCSRGSCGIGRTFRADIEMGNEDTGDNFHTCRPRQCVGRPPNG